MIPPTPWVRSFCPLSLLYPSVSDFQFRYTPVTVGKGRAAWFSLRSASVLSFGRGDKAAESGDVDYEYHHIIKGLYATFSSWHIDPCRFTVKCGGIYVTEHFILLPSLGVILDSTALYSQLFTELN